MVETYLAEPTDDMWRVYVKEYLFMIEERFKRDRQPFDKLAELAESKDVYLGCYCPTKKNPSPLHCHTYLALKFMKKKYPDLTVVYPQASDGEKIEQ